MLYIKGLSVGTLMDNSSPSLHFIQLLLPINFSFTLPASSIHHVSLVRSPQVHLALLWWVDAAERAGNTLMASVHDEETPFN
jgi:hypothetical protein